MADQIRHAGGALQGLAVARLLMPEQQPQHGVVVPPRIPLALAFGSVVGKAELLRPWAKVAIMGLAVDQAGHEVFK